jgi:hypothetical protein
MSGTERISLWLTAYLCLFMMFFEDKFLSHANPYDFAFYCTMLIVILVIHAWHWAREKLHKPD